MDRSPLRYARGRNDGKQMDPGWLRRVADDRVAECAGPVLVAGEAVDRVVDIADAGPRIDDDQLAAVLGGTAAHGEMPQPARAAHQCAHRQPRIGDALVGLQRSEERRAGKECVSTRISWWSTNH